jgi:hypothetical protein
MLRFGKEAIWHVGRSRNFRVTEFALFIGKSKKPPKIVWVKGEFLGIYFALKWLKMPRKKKILFFKTFLVAPFLDGTCQQRRTCHIEKKKTKF